MMVEGSSIYRIIDHDVDLQTKKEVKLIILTEKYTALCL